MKMSHSQTNSSKLKNVTLYALLILVTQEQHNDVDMLKSIILKIDLSGWRIYISVARCPDLRETSLVLRVPRPIPRTTAGTPKVSMFHEAHILLNVF